MVTEDNQYIEAGDLVKLVNNSVNLVMREDYMGKSLIVKSISNEVITKGLLILWDPETLERIVVYPGFVRHVFDDIQLGMKVRLDNGHTAICLAINNEAFLLDNYQTYSKWSGARTEALIGLTPCAALLSNGDGISCRYARAMNIVHELEISYSFTDVIDMLSTYEIEYARRSSWDADTWMFQKEGVLWLTLMNGKAPQLYTVMIPDVQATDWQVEFAEDKEC